LRAAARPLAAALGIVGLAMAPPALAQTVGAQTPAAALATEALFAQSRPAAPRPQPRPATPPRRPAPKLHNRLWISLNAGVSLPTATMSDSFEQPLYAETERVNVEYPSKSAVAILGNITYRLTTRFFIGGGLSQDFSSGAAKVTAALPHPFFDNTFRNIEGSTHATRGETGGHVLLGWMLPMSRTMNLLLTAGPSVINVHQTIVTDVGFSDVYPYDTATFTGATTHDGSSTGIGFNAGADLFWMRWKRYGVGALVQATHASVRDEANAGRKIQVGATQVRVAGGVRIFVGK
jgi:hypothetical protein